MQELAALKGRAASQRSGPSHGNSGPSVGIIIPVYGHSEYMAEALASAMAQKGIRQSVVLVIDGCRHPETYTRAYGWAAHHDNITLLAKSNSGLSGARNSGIEYFRQTRPDLDFIYFLDADNALGPNALSAAARQLADAPDSVAWVYPDIRTTGIFEDNLCARTYSRLAHLEQNVCEAGSMVRADVLWGTGVRFDETMRAGYEDWDFWLQLVGRGYKGAHCAELVLKYRRRPASMLASSHTMESELRSYLRRKHKALYRPRKVLELDREDTPRYLSCLVDTEEFSLHHHPEDPREALSLAQCTERLRLLQDGHPRARPLGKAVCFTTSAAYAALAKGSVLGALLHRVERLLDSGLAVVAVTLVEDSDKISIREVPDSASGAGIGHLFALAPPRLLDVLNDKSSDWLRGVMLGLGQSVMKRLEVTIHPQDCELVDPSGIEVEEVLSVVSKMRRIGFTDKPVGQQVSDRVWGRPTSGATAAAILRTRVPYNNARPDGRPIAAVTLPISGYGGAERVAHQIARVLRNEGFYTQLFIVWDCHVHTTRLLRLAFDEIVPLGLGRSGSFSGSPYLGTPVYSSEAAESGKLAELYSCLLGADVVVNCHVPEVNAIAARLRRLGIMTVASLHVFDLTAAQRPIGHPYLAAAYEHAYDRLAVASVDLGDKLLGLGVPRSKIVVVPNSVGVPEELLSDVSVRHEPGPATDDRLPLRCLYAGRLDRQKGIDRLVNVVGALKQRKQPVSWTVVGGSVLAEGEERLLVQELVRLGVECKPAIYDEQALVETLSGADVLVLPSYFEGLPLVLIEAMRLGVIPVATRVGGVAELIQDGVNGFLVPSDDNTDAALCQVITRLAEQPRTALAQIARKAAIDAGRRTWAASTAPLLAEIERHLKRRTREADGQPRPDSSLGQDAHVLTFDG